MFSQVFGYELRLEVKGQLVESQVCRNEDEILRCQERRRMGLERKGWTKMNAVDFSRRTKPTENRDRLVQPRVLQDCYRPLAPDRAVSQLTRVGLDFTTSGIGALTIDSVSSMPCVAIFFVHGAAESSLGQVRNVSRKTCSPTVRMPDIGLLSVA
jgi:hypothetical protein